MVSQDKLIKHSIKYTDTLFAEISKRLEKGVKASDSLEAFLDKYHKAFPDKGNPLISLGYDKTMIDLILSETNNHRFSRPAQKELVRVTVEEKVGERIVDVGEDIKDSVRDIVRDGYNRNLSQDEIALNISNRVSAIKGKRARAIARTEIARTATVSDYVINRERGANGWYVECRNTACPVCKDRWHKSWTPESDESFKPSDTSAGGKGWIGDRIFSMEDTGRLPPIHPNCRCVVYYTSEKPNVSTEPISLTKPTTETTTETIEETYKSLIPPKVTKKLDNFGNEYGASSKEHMQFFTENSQSSASHGSKGTVSKNGDQLNFMKNETSKGNVVHGTHNHPNDHEHYTMLSHEDVVDIFMGLNSDGIDLGSFSAENNRNRISVVKLPNYGEYTRYSEISGVKVDLRMTVNGVFSTYVDEYHKMRGTSSGGRLAYLREKRREIKEKYPDIKSYELFEKMEKYEKEADKIDWEKDHRKKIDETYKEMIMKVNKEVEPFGIRFEVKYKN